MSNKEDGFQIPAGSLISIDKRYVPAELLAGGLLPRHTEWSYDEARSTEIIGRNVYRSINLYGSVRYYMFVDDTGTTYATEA